MSNTNSIERNSLCIFDLSLSKGPPTNSDQSGSTSVLGASAGTITILTGQTAITVSTTKLIPNSLIFVTPDIPVAIPAKKIDTQTFQIMPSQPLYTNIHVNWWIIN